MMHDSALTDPLVAALTVIEAVMRPPPPADLNAWAEQHIVFGRESPVPGPYRRHTMLPAERILECLGPDHPARTVTLVSSAQLMKTTVAQIFVAATMSIDPSDMGYVHPSHDNAIRWSRRKWRTMRRNSPSLVMLFGEAKSRDATDTMLFQETRDGRGSLQISGANSAASLSMVSWPRQVQDDLSKWEHNEAGDPERQADARSAAFDWAKIFKISTPLHARTCRITRSYLAGTQERWHVPCPHCEHYQPLEWRNFQATIEQDNPGSAHFTCVSCGGVIEHRHKADIVARGRWVAENPAARDPSFYLWRAYAPTRDWESIAREWLAADGDPAAEQTFWNDVAGLPFERASEAPPWEAIRDRADAADYARGIVPHGALLICIGVDCQGDRTELHIKGFGEHLQRWTIDYHVIPHHIATAECRDALDGFLVRTWPDAEGRCRGVDMLAIDGNAWTGEVFGWARERKHPWSKVIIVRGAKSENAPPLALTKTERRDDGKTRKAQKRFYNVGTSGLKSSFYEQLKKVDPLARGYCGYPRGMADEFFRQMTAEASEIVIDRQGFPRSVWRLVHDRNEVLDTELYAEAAAIRCGWYTRTADQWGYLRAERETTELAVATPQPAAVKSADAVPPLSASALTTAAHPAPPKASFVRRGGRSAFMS